MNSMITRHTLSVLVENSAGVLSQVSRLFSRKGYNIESLAVGTTNDPAVSRITIEVLCDASMIEQIMKKYKKGCSVAETADMLEEPQTLIKQIYDVIGQCAPDYNVEAIYKILLDKTI